jgi:hypothetical protein
MFTRVVTLLVLIMQSCSFQSLFAQRGDSLKADLRLLKSKLESIHPALYEFIPAEKLDQLFDSCYQQLNNDSDDRQFYGLVKVILSAVRDGHLSSTTAPAFASFIHTQHTYLPLLTYFRQDSIFITRSIGSDIPAGSLLLSVNSHPAESMREKLYGFMTGDGFSERRKDMVLNELFYFYYYLAYGYSAGFTVAYLTPAGERKTVSLLAVEEKAIQALKPPAKEAPLLSATFTSDDIGIITIKTFNAAELQGAGLHYAKFLEQTFRKIRQAGINKLIIDLRGNGGGRDEYGVLLYSYLSKQPFRYYRLLETNKKKLSGRPGLGMQQPAALHYDGDLWVLTDGETFSAAAECCAVIYSNQRGTFIGQETGGRYEGNNSGQMSTVLLPASKVTVTIPSTKYVMDVLPAKYPGRGIIPHVNIQASCEAYLRNEDSVLQEGLIQARSR